MGATQGEASQRLKGNNGTEGEVEQEASAPSKVRFESFLPREEAISYFEAIVAGLKKGAIQFKQDGENLTLRPPSHLEVEVKVARKGGREKLSFELAWRVDEGSDLQIVSG